MARFIVAVIASWTLSLPWTVCAQGGSEPQPGTGASLLELGAKVAADPTTYVPAVMLFESMHLDWKSSQPFFAHGFVEDNPRFTVSGFGHDVAISYGAGKRQILKDTVATLPMSIANNMTSRVLERILAERFPNHRKLVATVGWIERIAFASYQSYVLSANHFRQWRRNERLAAQLGY